MPLLCTSATATIVYKQNCNDYKINCGPKNNIVILISLSLDNTNPTLFKLSSPQFDILDKIISLCFRFAFLLLTLNVTLDVARMALSMCLQVELWYAYEASCTNIIP